MEDNKQIEKSREWVFRGWLSKMVEIDADDDEPVFTLPSILPFECVYYISAFKHTTYYIV